MEEEHPNPSEINRFSVWDFQNFLYCSGFYHILKLRSRTLTCLNLYLAIKSAENCKFSSLFSPFMVLSSNDLGIDVIKVVESYSDIIYLNKKRKFQAETLDLPLLKQKCLDSSFSSVNDFPRNEKPVVYNFGTHIIKGKMIGVTKYDESETGSEKNSNSYDEDLDSSVSSAEAKIQSEYPKTRLSNVPSTSSFNWSSSSFKNIIHPLDSRLVCKSGGDSVESPYSGENFNFPCNGFRLNTSLNFDEHLDYSLLEEQDGYLDACTDKELEDMLYSNASSPNNYVLSSGRWSANQETQTSTEKLTIDKEFEQYFSMLML